MDALQETVIRLYTQNISLNEIQRRGICSWSKARKILINAGLYNSDRACRVREMLDAGATVAEISEELKIGGKAVNAYMPYTRGMKNAKYPTTNALRIRACRAKKRQQTSAE